MTDLNIRVVGMYALGFLILAACFRLISTVERITEANPTITTTAGPPARLSLAT